ncbi:universal stress protein [Pendulispora rubella]|uniref:Universal stress protein n=1 Tax=Pendulispora rubella TaxID=2741070 RepID=A0ABZ2KZW0_9BACT
MSTFQRILMATDLDEPSEAAAHTAASLARSLRAELAFVHIFAPPATIYSAYPDFTSLLPVEEVQTAAARALEAWLTRIEAPSQAKRLLHPGEPAQTILEVAESFSANLIVVGTHGRRGVSRALLGSTAEKLVRLSPVPVLTVREQPTPQ